MGVIFQVQTNVYTARLPITDGNVNHTVVGKMTCRRDVCIKTTTMEAEDGVEHIF